jgi:hypothetical protein
MKCYAYDNADKRRRERRKALTEAYNREHGIADVEFQPQRPVLSRKKRKPIDRVQKAINPIDFAFRAQIEKAANDHLALAEKRAEKQRQLYNRVRDRHGQQITARQKTFGKSIPLI